LLDRTNFFIKEHVGVLKLSDTYDIIDPDTQQQLGVAQEKLSFLIHALRLVIDKRMLPTKVEISEQVNGPAVLTIKRGLTFLRSRIEILDRSGQAIGYFKSKLFSLGGGFFVYDMRDQLIAEVKGDWKGWNFKFIDSRRQLHDLDRRRLQGQRRLAAGGWPGDRYRLQRALSISPAAGSPCGNLPVSCRRCDSRLPPVPAAGGA
jgi:uncharacterized protein YxjI